jgi:hypothetical protein
MTYIEKFSTDGCDYTLQQNDNDYTVCNRHGDVIGKFFTDKLGEEVIITYCDENDDVVVTSSEFYYNESDAIEIAEWLVNTHPCF